MPYGIHTRGSPHGLHTVDSDSLGGSWSLVADHRLPHTIGAVFNRDPTRYWEGTLDCH